jgi:uncharacterized protein YjbI with pentapeptide repeats
VIVGSAPGITSAAVLHSFADVCNVDSQDVEIHITHKNVDITSLLNLAQPNLAQPNLAQPNLAQPNLAQPNLAQPNLAQSNLALPNLI